MLGIVSETPHGIANVLFGITEWSLPFEIHGDRFFGKMSLGERALDMLICQLPISKVYAWAQCCANKYDPYGDPTMILRSRTGGTLRQLKDAYHRIKSEHKACTANGIPGLACHNLEDGSVNPEVDITSGFLVDLEDDDPILKNVQN